MQINEILKMLSEKQILIWSEGTSLKFKAPKDVINESIKEILKGNKTELIEYLAKNENIYFKEEKDGRYDKFPLTDIQNSYVVGRNEAFDLGGVGCHGYLEVEYETVLDPFKLERAWNKVIERHDMLRAIIYDNGYQIVQEKVPNLKVKSVDLRKGEKSYFRDELGNKQYKLGEWPMCEIATTIEEEKTIIHFSLDMLVADFISMNIILNDLEMFYKELEQEKVYISKYRDIVNYKIKMKEQNGSKRKLDEEYWNNKLSSIGEAPNLPVTQIKGLNNTRFYQKKIFLDKVKWEKLCNIAKINEITTSTLVMSTLAEVLSYWSDTNKFSINTTFFNRNDIVEDINDVVGDFTDVNVTSIEIDYKKNYIERIKDIQNTLWNDLEHNSFSGVEVLRKLTKERKRNVIIPVVFTSTIGLSSEDDVMINRKIGYKISQTPQVYIDCQLAEENLGVKINWDIREGVIDKNIINDMFDSFVNIIEEVCNDYQSIFKSKQPVKLSSNSIRMRKEVNETYKYYKGKMMEEVFLDSLRKYPNKTALIYEDSTYTYEELAEYVNTVYEILKKYNIKKGDRVGVNIDKNVWQIASVLAILLSKATYVPINVDQPIKRKRKIIDTSSIKIILSMDNELSGDQCYKNININEVNLIKKDMSEIIIEDDYDREAYIIFTSGTTGEPKGVTITHKAAMNTILYVNERYNIKESDVFLGLANLSFDLSVYDIFGCFAVGGTLVLPNSENIKDPQYIYELMLLHRVSIWNSVPAQIQLIINYLEISCTMKKSEYLRLAILSGDWIPVNLPNRIYNIFTNIKVVSMGGATEAGIWSIHYEIKKGEIFKESIPYGKPMANQKLYILNYNMKESPNYIDGNIYISGVGLSTGYLDDEKLNREKYLTFEDTNERIYKTGDIGYYREDGNIIFRGREKGDNQVKIYGHRVELSEIRSVLLSNPIVDSSVVFAVDDLQGEKKINAVVTPKLKVDDDIYVVDNDEQGILKELDLKSNKEVDGKLLEEWTRKSELVVLGDIIKTFNLHNIFTEEGKCHSYEDILYKIRTPEKLHKLIRRWLNVLVKERIIGLENEKYYLINKSLYLDCNKLWHDFYEVEDRFNYSKEFLDYLKKSSDCLPQLIKGEEDPLNILFPKGDIKPAMASYHDNKINRINNNFIVEDIVYLSNKNRKNNPNKKFRILEVGAGVGGTTIDLIPRLDGNNVEYYFTDLSNFFLNRAKDSFSRYDWIKYSMFDINEPFYKQNFDAFSFDVILCANVLHNSKDIHVVMENLKNLLKDFGTMVILEETKLSYMLLTSMEFKDGLVGFSDERELNEQTFFTRNQWENILLKHEGNIVYEFPEKGSYLDLSGQTVYIARFKNQYMSISKDKVYKYLKESLPSYMIPSYMKIVPRLPITNNGKVDFLQLKSLFINNSSIDSNESKGKNHLENKIEEIWCKELGVNHIELNDNFYNIGGDSLLIAQIIGKIIEEIDEAKEWEWSSLLTQMMQTPTIRELSKKIQDRYEKRENTIDSSLVEIKKTNKETKDSIAKVLFHAGTGTLSAYNELIEYIKSDSKNNESVLGFSFGNEAEYISMNTEDTFKLLGKKYGEILKNLGYSKYILIGHCVGGLIALEVAEYLKKNNMNVIDVTLISTTIPKDKSTTVFKDLPNEKYKKALSTSLENELLLERTFSRLINANIFKAGYKVNEKELDECIRYIVNELDGDLSINSFVNLDGEYKNIAMQFTVLSQTPISERLNKLYLSIERENMNLLDSERKMLNTLFNIFSQNFGCVASHEPKDYYGKVRVFSCEQQEESFYGEFFGENYETWMKYLKGNVFYDTVAGQHFDCLIGKNLKDNIDKILSFSY